MAVLSQAQPLSWSGKLEVEDRLALTVSDAKAMTATEGTGAMNLALFLEARRRQTA